LSDAFSSVGISAMLSPKDNRTYWTQDYDKFTCPTELEGFPIHSGSHLYFKATGNAVYGATFYDEKLDASTKVEGNVFIDGKQESLTLDLGSATKGLYIFRDSTFQQDAKYYFEFQADGKTFRYPQEGLLVSLNALDSKPSWVDK